MSKLSPSLRSKLQTGLLGVGFAVAVFSVQEADRIWSFWIFEHRWPALVDFMGRTVFEGQAFGGGDPVVLYLLTVLVAYYISSKRPSSRFYRVRPHLGFVILSAAVWALGLVHALKWAVGRARPFEVLYAGIPFTAWHDIGPHFISEGIYRGSFPSGHTSQAALLLTLGYILASLADDRPVLKPAAWIWSAAVVLFTAVMGAARVMAMSHWLTDVIGGFFFTWIGIHISYHWVLRVPDQTAFFRANGRWPRAPEAWELRLAGWLVGAIAGAAAAVLGARAFFRPQEALLGLLLPAGAALVLVCIARAKSLRAKALLELEGAAR